jgi:SAM-dependent methyltransferase
MAAQCPVGIHPQKFREELRRIYGRVASNPDGEFDFHRGPAYAAEFLGYDPDDLAALPADATASYAGIGRPLGIGPLHPGEVVLDIGCGSGMDLLLAARAVGAKGRAIGVDITEAMRQRATDAARAAGLSSAVEVRAGDAQALPVDDASIDVVISNGVLNLTVDKYTAFSELHRVLRPGGRVMIADVVVDTEPSADVRNDIDLWAS